MLDIKKMNIVSRKTFSLNINGALLEINRPLIMGILNVTPDSFYTDSRCYNKKAIISRLQQIVSEGADMIDIGAYSSRPQAADISVEEEKRRLAVGLSVIKKEYPNICISVDTFRADVAEWCIREYQVNIINDISGGEMDAHMFNVVAETGVPYIMMHMKGTPQTMMKHTSYENIVAELLQWFSLRIDRLTRMGAKDIIIDPGFGFSKTLEGNYELMNHLSEFMSLGLPILVGISRKSMIYKLLDSTPENSLNGTTVLNTLALLGGANILRVHDVKAAEETVKIMMKTLEAN